MAGRGDQKGDLFDYYAAGAVVLPHLRDRPFTMKRYREGAAAPFFQKDAPKGMPGWIPTRTFRTYPREGGSRMVRFPLVQDDLALPDGPDALHRPERLVLAWTSRSTDYVVFDLDPARRRLPRRDPLRTGSELMEQIEVASYVKTSGADGIHVLVPITRRAGFGDAYDFAEAASRMLERRHPGLVTTEWLKRKRHGVLLDHRQNGAGKTIAGVLGAAEAGRPGVDAAAVDELTGDLQPRDFTMAVALERIERHGDLLRAGPPRRPVAVAGAARARAPRRSEELARAPGLLCGAAKAGDWKRRKNPPFGAETDARVRVG